MRDYRVGEVKKPTSRWPRRSRPPRRFRRSSRPRAAAGSGRIHSRLRDRPAASAVHQPRHSHRWRRLRQSRPGDRLEALSDHLVSDAGGQTEAEEEPKSDLGAAFLPHLSIWSTVRCASLRKRQVIDFFKAARAQGRLLGHSHRHQGFRLADRSIARSSARTSSPKCRPGSSGWTTPSGAADQLGLRGVRRRAATHVDRGDPQGQVSGRARRVKNGLEQGAEDGNRTADCAGRIHHARPDGRPPTAPGLTHPRRRVGRVHRRAPQAPLDLLISPYKTQHAGYVAATPPSTRISPTSRCKHRLPAGSGGRAYHLRAGIGRHPFQRRSGGSTELTEDAAPSAPAKKARSKAVTSKPREEQPAADRFVHEVTRRYFQSKPAPRFFHSHGRHYRVGRRIGARRPPARVCWK